MSSDYLSNTSNTPKAVSSPRMLNQGVDVDTVIRKEIYAYYAPWPVYALDWSRSPGSDAFRLAVGSFLESPGNKIQVLRVGGAHTQEDYRRPQDLVAVAEHDHPFPCTQIRWQPYRGGHGPDILATTADTLRIWEAKSFEGGGERLIFLQELCSGKGDVVAPLTSLDWCDTQPAQLVTCSIDTTCTVWNVETRQAKTQLIAHDREVFDVAWITGTSDIFASVGADGSVRMFDLRSLDHSSIIYETPALDHQPTPPLLRLSANKMDANYLACLHLDSSTVQVLDIRLPGTPVAELKAHSANVNALGWSPHNSGLLSTAGDDCQVLVWDLKPQSMAGASGRAKSAPVGLGTIRDPVLAYTASSEVNVLSWSVELPEWLAMSAGRTVQAVHT